MINHQITLSLKTIYSDIPAHIEILIDNRSVFNNLLLKDSVFEFDYPDNDTFNIEIKKTGKNIDIVKKNQKQEVVIDKLLLNGFDLHPDKFGIFSIKDNPYVKDHEIQTNKLTLNGLWTFTIPLFSLEGESTLKSHKGFKDSVSNSSIACFGCSFTYGFGLQDHESWPAVLSKLTGLDIKNYGIGGSNNQEIIANALEYVKTYKTKNIILLLCHFCRLQLKKGNKLYNWIVHIDTEKEYYKLFTDHIDKMINFSETTLLFSRQVPYFLKTIEEIKKNISGQIFVSTYIEDHYECLKKIDNKNFILLPFYEMSKEYPLAFDNKHPGAEHNRLFAESIVKYLK
jgi:hypothetical protein